MDQINPTNQYGTHDVVAPEPHNKKRTLMVVGGMVLVIAVLVFGLYTMNQKNKVYTMNEIEELLKEASRPVTATSQEQAAAMQALENSAPAPTATIEEREQQLRDLPR